MSYGTLQVIDSLRTYNNTNVVAFGEENLAGYINQIIAGYNAMYGEIERELIGAVPMRETTWGTNSSTMDMVDLDEFGLADAQKIPFAPASTGFPLRRKGATLQWTRDFLATTTPAELGLQAVAITEADARRRYADIRRVLFNAANNTTYIDRLVDNRTFTIRALLNADGQAIPPNSLTNSTYDGATHTHYLATATLVEANYVSLEETVREHGLNGGQIRIYINQAQEATVRAFAGFNAYVDARIVYSDSANRASQTVDIVNTEDRAIGFHGVAEVWVKPWVPANYHLCFV
ncbi:MAG: hypothetical protein M3Q74_00910, partial [Pseudomonadota bacterium]|nr:hypothetical protein [Pseudomonadota bacterium]